MCSTTRTGEHGVLRWELASVPVALSPVQDADSPLFYLHCTVAVAKNNATEAT